MIEVEELAGMCAISQPGEVSFSLHSLSLAIAARDRYKIHLRFENRNSTQALKMVPVQSALKME